MSKSMKAIHVRIVVGGLVLLAALAAWLYEGSYWSVRR
jgi:hypothetical protein